jgi:ribosome-associated protein
MAADPPIPIDARHSLDPAELEFNFIRASGPGGQNVNKVATAVQLRFDPARADLLSDDVKGRLRTLAGSRLTGDGVIVIEARAFRTQLQNREDARARLVDLIRRALVRPKRRRKTRPGAGAVQRRLDTKKLRGAAKRDRGRRPDDD